MIEKIRNLCDILKHITPHSFRRAFATFTYNSTKDIKATKELCGHENI